MTPDGRTFHCDTARFEEHAIIGVHGDLDETTASALEREVLAVLGPPINGVVLDFAYCRSMNEAGASVLTDLNGRARALGIDFRLTSVPVSIEAVLPSRVAEP